MVFTLFSLASYAMYETASFQCPQCDSVYQVVRVEAESACDRAINCPVCHAPLRSRDGGFILKYFLTGPSKRSYAAARPGTRELARVSTANLKTAPSPA
jgi:hypothetical protein